MELFKTIIQGKLLYANPKSFAKALKMYNLRVETYYKNDIIFESEDIFNEETNIVEIPRLVRQLYEKTFKNTVDLLGYCSQFAVSGFIDAWLIHDGKITIYKHLEPVSDKIAVKQFIKGRDLISEQGREEDAIAAFDKAIEKYDNHAMAYDRRAKVNFMLQKYHDAKRDYGKSINIDSTNPYPYFGRAEVHMFEENWEEAIEDLEKSIKLSVALQSVYWSSRRLKSICHFNVKQFEKAEFDLKLFTKRKFDDKNPNIEWIPWANVKYAKVLIGLEKFDEALEALNTALESEETELKEFSTGELLRLRAICKKELGKNGYKADLKEASNLGDEIAKQMLVKKKK